MFSRIGEHLRTSSLSSTKAAPLRSEGKRHPAKMLLCPSPQIVPERPGKPEINETILSAERPTIRQVIFLGFEMENVYDHSSFFV
jgi:hypothetical protein